MKNKLVPKNPEQEKAVQIGRDFLDKGNPDEFLIIGGKAGTGKTTIAEMILQPYINKKTILVCALSHKAKLVLSEKLSKAYGGKSIISKSVAGALGMNMDAETGKFVLDRSLTTDPAIKTADIIVVDEASMINETSHHLIMTEKRKKAKVIYLGDIRQLPPIRENGDPLKDTPSPVFFGKNIAVLKERIRQGEDSPILPFADYFGDNSRVGWPALNPAPSKSRIQIVSKDGALVFADNITDVIEVVLPLFQFAVDTGNMNVIKIVCYRNDTRKFVNTMIRLQLFGIAKATDHFTEGDLLMFQDNYVVADLTEPISNSLEIQITKAESITDEDYKVWKLEFIHEAKPITILVLHESEVQRHAADVSKKFNYAKSLPFGDERTTALGKAWGLKRRYALVDHAYAITSHKCQGSTYNTVIVNEKDIMSVGPISNKEKSQSMYTAITRASTTCIVIDGQDPEESLQKAIELSTQKLNINIPQQIN